jgi:hypothetical protein
MLTSPGSNASVKNSVITAVVGVEKKPVVRFREDVKAFPINWGVETTTAYEILFCHPDL